MLAGVPAADSEHKPELLEEMAATILDAAKTLVAALDGRVTTSEAWQVIRDLEHKGDAIARDLFEAPTTRRVGPASAESVQELTGYLDDVLDAIEAAAARLMIHRVRRVHPSARAMGQVVLESARELGEAIAKLPGMHDVLLDTGGMHPVEDRAEDVLGAA